MNKKLKLKLFFKGKLLDIISSERDFKKSFYIGSDKHLFWQILDTKFPKKHKFIEKKGDKYQINLLKSMKLEINSNEKPIDLSSLRKKSLLKGTKLILAENTEGIIHLDKDWSIHYFFQPERKQNLTRQQKAIVKRYKKYEKLPPEKRFTLVFMFFSLLIAILGTFIAHRNYEPPTPIVTSIQEKINLRDELVSQVEIPQIDTVKQPSQEGQEEEVKEVEETDEEAAGSAFGGINLDDYSGDTGNEEAAEFIEVTKTEVLSVEGGTPGTSGTGTGPAGTGTSGDGTGGDDLESAFGTTDDISLGGDDIASLGDVSASDLDLESFSGLEEVDDAEIKQNIKAKSVKKLTSKSDFETYISKVKVNKSIKAKDIETSEGSTNQGGVGANLNNQFRALKPRLDQIYNKMRWVEEMYGTIICEVLILDNGKIEKVFLRPTTNSKFSDEFLENITAEMKTWKIYIDSTVRYEFRLTFISR